MIAITELPALNAGLNAVATVFLLSGWCAIRSGRQTLHRNLMVAALVTSALFLTSYLIYHFNAEAMTRYPGDGLDKVLYLLILFTHIPLAILVVPGCLMAVFFAVKGRFDAHRKVTRWLWPVWMYVSVTGVLIYLMLYILPA